MYYNKNLKKDSRNCNDYFYIYLLILKTFKLQQQQHYITNLVYTYRHKIH